MAKVHINDNGEVKPCSASVKECQFGNGDGSNHFETVAEAEAEVQRRHNEEYGEVATHTKEARREREEYAPRVVDNALTVDEVKEAKSKK